MINKLYLIRLICKKILRVRCIQKCIKNEKVNQKLFLFALSKLTPFELLSLLTDFKRQAVAIMELPNKTEGTLKIGLSVSLLSALLAVHHDIFHATSSYG